MILNKIVREEVLKQTKGIPNLRGKKSIEGF